MNKLIIEYADIPNNPDKLGIKLACGHKFILSKDVDTFYKTERKDSFYECSICRDEEDGLLSCPFCGSIDIKSRKKSILHVIYCNGCSASVSSNSLEAAEELWNTRQFYEED